MQFILTTFLEIQAQAQILHWQTKSYARHQAYGQFYKKLTELIDEFVEVYQGKYGIMEFEQETSVLTVFNANDRTPLDEWFDGIVEFLVKDLPGELDSEEDTDLLNLRDELLATVNKLKYLLTLE